MFLLINEPVCFIFLLKLTNYLLSYAIATCAVANRLQKYSFFIK